MPQFKAGDKIRCIRKGGGVGDKGVHDGEIYTFDHYVIDRVHAEGALLFVKERGDRQFYSDRFELVEEKEAIMNAVKIMPVAKPLPRRKKGEIRVGDVVVCDKYQGAVYGYVAREMNPLVGKEGVVVEVTEWGVRVHGWYWPFSAVKRVIKRAKPVAKGAVAKAPVKPAVEAVKALPEPFKVGDKVVTSKFADVGHYGDGVYMAEYMVGLIGKEGVVIQEYGERCRVAHENGGDWEWPKSALKHVDAKKGQPVAVPPKKAAIIKPEPVKPALPDIREELNKKVGAHPGTCSYALQFDDGTVRWQTNDACHARIIKSKYDHKEEHKKVVAIANNTAGHYKQMKGDKEQQASYKNFIEYLVQRSFMKDIYIPTPNPVEDGVLFNLNYSANNIAVAAIALREGSEEYAGEVVVFDDLVKGGIPEDAAWLTSRFFKKHAKGYAYSAANGHDTVNAATNLDKIMEVFKNGLHMNEKPFNDAPFSYTVYKCFGYDRDEKGFTLDALFRLLVPKLGAGGGGWDDRGAVINAEDLLVLGKAVAKLIKSRRAKAK